MKSFIRSIVAVPIITAAFMLAAAQPSVNPLDIKERTLPNGLRVVTQQDNASPTVSIHVWYNVGGKNDPVGKSGFAHMFEHMMFKSTRNMPNEKMDRLTEDVGGFNNASTWPDYTNYFEVVPSNHLEKLLWAESDRMVNLNVDDANFSSEREVVKEEYRQRILANPYGQMFEYSDSLSYQVHPYKRGVIGNLDELDAATPADAFKFYKDFYRPDNAVLIVVGDFEQKQLDQWIDKYFKDIKKPADAITRVTAKEPEWTKERRYEKFGPMVPFPGVIINYLGPVSSDKDIASLQVIQNILAGGDSSRLYQQMVREQQIAQEAAFQVDVRVDKGLLTFLGIASEKGTSDSMEKAFLAEIKKLQTADVSRDELAKAKNQLIFSSLMGRETNDGRANLIERAVAFAGDPRAVNRTIADLEKVTAADIRRVMNKYFKDNNRVVIHYNQQPEGSDEK